MAPALTFASPSHAPVRIHPKPPSAQPPWTPPSTRTSSIMTYHNAVQFSGSCITETRTPATIRIDCVSHIFYSSSKLWDDGTVTLGDPYIDAERLVDNVHGCLRACSRLREQNNYLKILLSIGGCTLEGSEMFSRIAANEITRERFAITAKNLVDTFELDGVDVAWENISRDTDANNFILLLSDLREHLAQRDGYLLTASLSFNTWIDFKPAAHYLDLVNLKCFDFAAPDWSDNVSHASQVYSTRESDSNGSMTCYNAIDWMSRHGLPPKKILFGIPAFGRGYVDATRLGEDYSKKKGRSRTFPVCELPRPGTHYEFDGEAKACYSTGGDGGWVSFDTPWSVNFKAELAKANRLAGLTFWEALGDYHDNERSLVYAGYKNLLPDGVQG